MLSTENFKIIKYSSMIATFGGVEEYHPEEETEDVHTVIQGVGNVVKSIGDSLERTYNVDTILQHPRSNLLLTKVTPVKAKLDKGSVELDLGYSGDSEATKQLRILMEKMTAKNIDTAIVTRKDNTGLYLLQMLQETFNPVSIGEFLKNTKCILLKLAGQKVGATKTEVKPDYLEVDVELNLPEMKPPDPRIYY